MWVVRCVKIERERDGERVKGGVEVGRAYVCWAFTV